MHNPSLQNVEKGDKFIGGSFSTARSGFIYESFVLDVGQLEKRFGKDDRIITVCVRSVGLDGEVLNIIDASKLLWWSQLTKGLV